MAVLDSNEASPSENETGARDEAIINRKIIPRRGHTKSRRGCVTCKRRRVKCPENTPVCRNCERLGLFCQYGVMGDLGSHPSAPLQSTGGHFSIGDFQLFHHFVLYAYPPLPIQGKAVWDGVCQFSHQFDFLIHAMLALSASHFDLCSGSEGHKTQALSHRTTAIARINKALDSPAMSGTRGDALYAALMVLAFQSSYMSDGMLEIYPMIRGCMMMLKSASINLSLFRQFTVQDHEEQVRTILQREPLSDHSSPPLKLLLESLRAIRPLCQSKLEIDYFGIVENIIAMSTYSQVFSFFEAYHVFSQPTQEEFDSFMSPRNYVAQLLMIHFFIVEYAVGLKMIPSILSSMRFKSDIIRAWVTEVETILPKDYKCYIACPMELMAMGCCNII
ncbi:unnamed protein product [Clonostachys chloroleuca]|uniref:Zn(2)-C6 fungal-type domain-containing protein n=1 Tax=Clonostachys chloroleuca TaxID=1926264 RepID=A0AA35LV85_9HYPO|nr:unnamed protein product [Clonostachys chloroleuca]